VIPKIGFMRGGVLAAVSDNAVYGISAAGEEAWKYPLENMLQQVSLTNKNCVVLALGDAIANKDGRKKGTICWLDSSGKESASYESGGDVEYLQVSELGVIIGDDKLYFGLKNSGKQAWSYRAMGDVRDIIPMEQLDQVLLVTKNQAVLTPMKGTQTVKSIVPESEEVLKDDNAAPEDGNGQEDAAKGKPEDGQAATGGGE